MRAFIVEKGPHLAAHRFGLGRQCQSFELKGAHARVSNGGIISK
jgi:hypothetical protein